MKRLKIIIPQEKRYILAILYDKFPHWACDMLHNDKPVIFTAMLQEGVDYSSDLAWLKRIGLEYLDEQMERKKIITAFFKDALIEGMAVTNVLFREGNLSHPASFSVLLTLRDSTTITLHFPHYWEPPTII